MKKYLITGCAGFIGSNFVYYMLKKYEDILLVNLDKLTYAGNLENLKGVEGDSRHIFVQGDICSSEFNSSYYYKKNKKLLKKYSKFFTKSAGNDEFLLIKNKDILHSFAILATRDISPVIFYFRNSKIMLLLNGCIGLIYYGLPKEDLLTKQIADNCSLYLY